MSSLQLTFKFGLRSKEDDALPIWELKPIALANHNWSSSRWKERALIRASNEQRAREIADRAFAIAAEKLPGSTTPLSPWIYGDLVEVRSVELEGWSQDGEEAIIEPMGYDDDQHL